MNKVGRKLQKKWKVRFSFVFLAKSFVFQKGTVAPQTGSDFENNLGLLSFLWCITLKSLPLFEPLTQGGFDGPYPTFLQSEVCKRLYRSFDKEVRLGGSGSEGSKGPHQASTLECIRVHQTPLASKVQKGGVIFV